MGFSDFWLQSNNGKRMSPENFRELKKSDLNNNSALIKIFNLFDTQNADGTKGADGVLNKEELASLFNAMSNAAKSKGDASIFEINEAEEYIDTTLTSDGKTLKESGVNVSDLFNFLNTLVQANSELQPQQTQSNINLSNMYTPKEIENLKKQQFTPDEIENISIQTLTDYVKKARHIFNSQNKNQGAISNFVNQTKETFNTEYAASRVNRYIMREELCAELLTKSKSKEGLSEKEYLEAKINLAISMLPHSEKESEIELLRIALRGLTPEDLTELIQNIVEASDEEYNNNAAKYAEQLIKSAKKERDLEHKNKSTLESGIKSNYRHVPVPGSIEDIESNKKAYRKMSFEETFEVERSIQYNTDNILEYDRKNANLQFLLGMHNKRAQIYNLLHTPTATVKSDIQFGSVNSKVSEKQLESAIILALQLLYGDDIEKMQEGLNKLGIDNLKIVDGSNLNSSLSSLRLIFVNEDINNQNPLNNKTEPSPHDLLNAATKLQNIVDTSYEKALNGKKTLEEHSESVKSAYQMAYGARNAEGMAEAFSESQQEGVQTVKSAIQIGGMVVMVAGQLIPAAGQAAATMTMGGLITSTIGGTAVSAIENYTKAGGPTEEDKKEMLQELAIGLALVGSGMGIGITSEAAFRALVVRNCPKLLAWASEVGIDATMSIIADCAITGQIDLSGEGIAQLQAVLVGILHAKGNFKTYLNTHAGALTTKTPLSNDVRQKISDNFDELKSKIRQDLLQYESYKEKYSEKSKQTLLEIAEIDTELADIILRRYDSVSDLSNIKKAALLDVNMTKKILSLHSDRTIIKKLKGKKIEYSNQLGYGNAVLRMVKALQAVPELNRFLVIGKTGIIEKTGEIIETCGIEFLRKKYDDLDINSKYKLLNILMQERGTTNSTLTHLPDEVQELFPAIPACCLKGNSGDNPQYIGTIKKLYDDIFKTDYHFDNEYVKDFNSYLNNFISCKKESDMKLLAQKFKDAFANINLNYPIENIEIILKNFLTNNNIKNLSESRQKVFLTCELLKSSNQPGIRVLSKSLFGQLGFSSKEIEQIYRILSVEDLFNNLKNCKTNEELELLMYNIAFKLKDEESIDIADQLYNLSKDGVTVVREVLKQISFKIKSSNFAMPQTSKENYLSVAHLETVSMNGKDYNLYVVKASELRDFNTYTHTIRGTSSQGSSLVSERTLLEKYNLFSEINDDNVFCVTYITKDNIGVLDKGIGLTFEVPLECQYVGAGYDIGSLARSVQDLLSDYYVPNSRLQENVGWNMHENVEGSHLRQIVSSNLKGILGISDIEYVQKWDNIIKQLNGQQLTIKRLEQIDKEMANAYKTFLSRSNNAQEYKDDCVLRSSRGADEYKTIWNEFLVSKPIISGIYMNVSKIENLQQRIGIESWLKFAEENRIPIILLK